MAHTLTWMKWAAWGDFAAVPYALTQLSPLAFLSMHLSGDVAQNEVRLTDGWAPDTLTGLHASSALLMSLLLVYLLSWCSFALSLRRLRDLRGGLYLLPLCLPYFWAYLTHIIFDSPASPFLAALLFILLTTMLFCIPSRTANKELR